MGEAETERPAAEASPAEPTPGERAQAQRAEWNARDRVGELADLAADPDAVEVMRRRLTAQGIVCAANPFQASEKSEARTELSSAKPKSELPAGDDWRRWLPSLKGRE